MTTHSSLQLRRGGLTGRPPLSESLGDPRQLRVDLRPLGVGLRPLRLGLRLLRVGLGPPGVRPAQPRVGVNLPGCPGTGVQYSASWAAEP